MTPPKKNRPRSTLAALPVLALLCSCADLRDVFAPYRPTPEEIRDVLDHPPTREQFDAALVLGCPASPDGSASPCERCRVKTAVRTFRRGRARMLLFSGAAAHSPHVEADVMADLAVARGVPRDRILTEPRALTTWQNLRYSARLLRAHHLETVLIISTSDHLPRARRMARYYGLTDAQTGYVACDLDLPMDSDAEFVPPEPTGPTVAD